MASLKLDEETAKVLSSDTRKEIIKSLDERNMTVTELSRKLGLSKSTVHEHLSKLLDSGFVNKLDEEGKKWVYYKLTKKGKDVVGNRVKKVLLFASSAIAGIFGVQQLFSYITAKQTMEEAADIEPMAGVPEATETAVETTNGNLHLLAAILLFATAAALITYYYKKVR